MPSRKHPLMGHLVLGYPDLPTSLETARTYAKAGLQYLELQLPFSHPTADGSRITQANRTAVANGTSLADCLSLIRTLAAEYPGTEIVAMTYANRVFAGGMDRFCAQLAAAGATQLIVPDLALDSPLAEPLRNQPHLKLVPVLGPNTAQARLQDLLHLLQPRLVYLMSGYKLTGGTFALDERLTAQVHVVRAAGAKAGIGFGIDNRAAVKAVLQVADVAIVGSALLKAHEEGTLAAKLAELIGQPQPA